MKEYVVLYNIEDVAISAHSAFTASRRAVDELKAQVKEKADKLDSEKISGDKTVKKTLKEELAVLKKSLTNAKEELKKLKA